MTVAALVLSMILGGWLLTRLSRRPGPAGRFGPPIVFGALVLWLWQVTCQGFNVPVILLPAPDAIALAIVRHLPMLGADFVQTVLRSMLPGYLLGCATGLLAAIVLDRSPFLRRGVLPLASLLGAMPIVGIAPVMVMWFGFDWPSKAAVVFVMTVFPMLVNTLAGLAEPGAMERDLMRSYAASDRQTLFKLRLPAALPFIFNALKLNTTLGLIGAIVAEFFGTPIVGMGFRISTEAARLDLAIVWAEIVLAAVVGATSFYAIAWLERVLTFWHPSMRRN